MVSKGTSRCSD